MPIPLTIVPSKAKCKWIKRITSLALLPSGVIETSSSMMSSFAFETSISFFTDSLADRWQQHKVHRVTFKTAIAYNLIFIYSLHAQNNSQARMGRRHQKRPPQVLYSFYAGSATMFLDVFLRVVVYAGREGVRAYYRHVPQVMRDSWRSPCAVDSQSNSGSCMSTGSSDPYAPRRMHQDFRAPSRILTGDAGNRSRTTPPAA